MISKKTSVINIIEENQHEDSDPEIIVETLDSNPLPPRRKSAYVMSNSAPIKTRQRSNTITYNMPPNFSNFIEEETEEFVDVRDEILLIKEQFDKLCSVLDDDLLPPPTLPTPNDIKEKSKK